MKSRKWLTWLGVVIAVLAFVGAVGLVLMPASASGLPFTWMIRSNLSADYRYGETSASFGTFRLSIIGDMLRDMGMGDKEATQRENVMKLVMDASVPTATAFDYEGNPPLTATATNTATPTNTPTSTPTSTATNTPRPTATKTKTPKPKPTKTPIPPTGATDVTSPQIVATILSPTPGSNITVCQISLTVEVKDPAFSAGVYGIEGKHTIPGGTPEPYNWTTITSGSGTFDGEGDWVGSFNGMIMVKHVSHSETFEIYFKAKDNAGNYSGWKGPLTYTLDPGTNCP